jgi:uncharacterized protein YcgL (UPF0745 family)
MITNIIDAKTIQVTEKLNKEKLFLYGQKVDDFHVVNNNVLLTVSISMIQELDKQLQTTKQELQTTKQELQTQIDFIKSKLML